MDEESSPYRMIQECEAAIIRIRAAIRSGTANAPEVGDDWEQIRSGVTKRFTWYARSVRALAPEADAEALDAMFDRLLDDVWSLTYVSIETQLGAYLHSMPIRILSNMRRKYVRDAASLIERLDDDRGGELPSRHELIADPQADGALRSIGDREALAQALSELSAVERYVIQLRLDGQENNAIARLLGVSAATATRINKRAVAALQRRLGATEE